jgi:DNA-binding NarL/FixJ family response regulator
MKPVSDAEASRPIRVFLLLENRLLREALVGILQRQPDLEVVAAQRYESQAYTAIVGSRSDVLLLDQPTAKGCPSGFIANLTAASPHTRVVFFGMEDDEETFLQVIRSGVSGYLLGDASTEDTLAAVRKVARGNAVCPAHLCLELFRFVAKAAREGSLVLNRRLCTQLGLTSRQQQLVALLAKGLTNKEIAATLNLSEFTVKNHVHRIMRLLNADTRHAAVATVCDGDLAAVL